MEELKVGDTLKDNDPRMENRVLIITELLPDAVMVTDTGGRLFRCLRRRIHTDGKPRKSGLSLLRKNA